MALWQPQDLVEGLNHAGNDARIGRISKVPEHIPPHETRGVERMIEQEFPKHHRHCLDALEPKL